MYSRIVLYHRATAQPESASLNILLSMNSVFPKDSELY